MCKICLALPTLLLEIHKCLKLLFSGNLKVIFDLTLKLLSNGKIKQKIFFQILWPSQIIWTLILLRSSRCNRFTSRCAQTISLTALWWPQKNAGSSSSISKNWLATLLTSYSLLTQTPFAKMKYIFDAIIY